MDLSIIIVNYNTVSKSAKCLRSIYTTVKDIDFEVLLVDNNSTEPITELELEFSGVRYFKNTQNLGMGAGNNVGIREANGELVLILNPDTELTVNALAEMLSYIKTHPDVGLVGPRLNYPDGTRQESCYQFPSLLMPFYRRTFLGIFGKGYLEKYLYRDKDLNQTQEVDWIMGSCLLIRRGILEKAGGFDERFFMYFEDTDLCRQIKRLNFKIVYLPSALVIHHHGRASAKDHWATAILSNNMLRIHLVSWLKYSWKWL